MPSVRDSFDTSVLPSLPALDSVRFRVVSDIAEAVPLGQSDALGYLMYSDESVDLPGGWTRESLTAEAFEGKAAEALVIPAVNAATLVICGLGKNEDAGPDDFREAGARMARAVRSRLTFSVVLPRGASTDCVQAFVEGALMARYRFLPFRHAESCDEPGMIQAITLVEPDSDAARRAELEMRMERAKIFARATFVARDLTNAPPGHLTAPRFAAIACELAEKYGFGAKVVSLAELDEMGCGGIVGVNRGSTNQANLVELRYPAERTDEDHSGRLALVGKGITFDSGGLSLKPALSMMDMKMDMGGAAAILGAFTSFSGVGVTTAVDAWLPITDNMISGDSLRVGEVITARNGKTVEVNNTDAEGRLVLMDALSLAAESKPSWIVDIATLTGAQLIALGTDIAAVMGTDGQLLEHLGDSAAAVGEPIWELPLHERYLKILESPIADIANANVKNRAAGTITAGLFLSQFVADVPWAHLDIAGPMSSATNERWNTVGATGFGARLLLDLAATIND